MRNIFTKYLFKLILKFTSKTANEMDDKILAAFEKPIRMLIVIMGLYFASRYAFESVLLDETISRLFRSSLVILIAWGIYDLAGSQSVLSEELKKKLNLDNILISFFSKFVRFIIIAMAIVVIAQEWDYDVNGFIAGLGLGGLAFALAAQDTLANVFGGMIIIMEKPFLIGDWIQTPSTEGHVEDITFRSTKVRAFNQSLITVPNSTLAKEAITNYTRMGMRRITFHLGVTYDTPRHKMENVVKQIKEMLKNDSNIHPQTIFVFFEKFNDSSLDIFLYFFTNTTNWEEFLAVRQNVNFKIMEILENEQVSVAFPSRSIYFENPQVVKINDN
ncbi:MAG: mechanosensitive ion channel family protein [Syntrophomonadaceae bacterium]|nr:mechanosensitive ion channel family protein [Syntrophomonadaceae bacterium]